MWVHCGTGYRAAAAASLLARAGRRVVHIDDAYARAADAGLPITTSNGETFSPPSTPPSWASC
ncbi:hypothetical protein GCM10020216_079660 [Nonomuraea helvata]